MTSAAPAGEEADRGPGWCFSSLQRWLNCRSDVRLQVFSLYIHFITEANWQRGRQCEAVLRERERKEGEGAGACAAREGLSGRWGIGAVRKGGPGALSRAAVRRGESPQNLVEATRCQLRPALACAGAARGGRWRELARRAPSRGAAMAAAPGVHSRHHAQAALQCRESSRTSPNDATESAARSRGCSSRGGGGGALLQQPRGRQAGTQQWWAGLDSAAEADDSKPEAHQTAAHRAQARARSGRHPRRPSFQAPTAQARQASAPCCRPCCRPSWRSSLPRAWPWAPPPWWPPSSAPRAPPAEERDVQGVGGQGLECGCTRLPGAQQSNAVQPARFKWPAGAPHLLGAGRLGRGRLLGAARRLLGGADRLLGAAAGLLDAARRLGLGCGRLGGGGGRSLRGGEAAGAGGPSITATDDGLHMLDVPWHSPAPHTAAWQACWPASCSPTPDRRQPPLRRRCRRTAVGALARAALSPP